MTDGRTGSPDRNREPHMRLSRPTAALGVLLGSIILVLGPGCEAPYKPLPYVPKPSSPPQMLVCHDAVGHVKGNKPWILGGNCCCTPTPENYRQHVADGTIDKSMSYEDYRKLYRDQGIVTDLDHKGCGNLCGHSPHVVLGGKCMATPTPGTPMYEQVTFGPHKDITAPPPTTNK